MKFTKIDENTVRCVVSEEEMEAYDVELEDFVKKNKKVRDFVELLIDKAGDEVGYEHVHGMMQLQLQPLPKRGLAITFSSREVTPEDLTAEIAAQMGEGVVSMEEISAALQEVKDAMAEENSMNQKQEDNQTADQNVIEKNYKEKSQDTKKQSEKNQSGKNQKEKDEEAMSGVPNLYICRFRSMNDIGRFCAQVPARYYVESSIYKDTNGESFYMVIRKGRCKKVKYLFTCRLALEFGTLDSCNETRFAHIQEQCECLVAENAIKVIRKIYQ